jgi:hypothetical protein
VACTAEATYTGDYGLYVSYGNFNGARVVLWVSQTMLPICAVGETYDISFHYFVASGCSVPVLVNHNDIMDSVLGYTPSGYASFSQQVVLSGPGASAFELEFYNYNAAGVVSPGCYMYFDDVSVQPVILQ